MFQNCIYWFTRLSCDKNFATAIAGQIELVRYCNWHQTFKIGQQFPYMLFILWQRTHETSWCKQVTGDTEVILFAVHSSQRKHWMLAVFHIKLMLVVYYDSLSVYQRSRRDILDSMRYEDTSVDTMDALYSTDRKQMQVTVFFHFCITWRHGLYVLFCRILQARFERGLHGNVRVVAHWKWNVCWKKTQSTISILLTQASFMESGSYNSRMVVIAECMCCLTRTWFGRIVCFWMSHNESGNTSTRCCRDIFCAVFLFGLHM